jgi:hypothetical protein
MAKIDNFKLFVKNNPNLITYVKNNTMSWQKFYELYDLGKAKVRYFSRFIYPTGA